MKLLPLRSLALSLLVLLFVGCAHVQETKFTNPSLGNRPPLPARVALVISPDTADFHHRYSAMGENWDYHFGPAIRQYARHVTQSAFAEVKEFPTLAAAAHQADAVITVGSAKAEHTLPMSAWGVREFVLRLDWTVSDRTGQSPLWQKTMESRAGRPWGSRYSWDETEMKIMQDLFTDLSMKTHQALTESPELKQIQHTP